MTYYEALDILGIAEGSDTEEIREAYRTILFTSHPENFPAGTYERRRAEKEMERIDEAYHVLRTGTWEPEVEEVEDGADSAEASPKERRRLGGILFFIVSSLVTALLTSIGDCTREDREFERWMENRRAENRGYALPPPPGEGEEREIPRIEPQGP